MKSSTSSKNESESWSIGGNITHDGLIDSGMYNRKYVCRSSISTMSKCPTVSDRFQGLLLLQASSTVLSKVML